MIAIQYDFFEQVDELSILRKEIESVQESSDSVRKGLFARHKKLEDSLNTLLGMYLEQQKEIDCLKIHLKRGPK